MSHKMLMPREDFNKVRELLAEKGVELTPDELLSDLRVAGTTGLVDEPGLVSLIKELRRRLENDR